MKEQACVEKSKTKQCPKCNGTGFFCLYILDEQPVSNTGYKCWKCNGTGIVEKKERQVRCPRCGILWPKSQINNHRYSKVSKDENGKLIDTVVECKEV